ncbi:MAG: hypothetical protein ACOCXY_00830 [Planctomycetota bacterium]
MKRWLIAIALSLFAVVTACQSGCVQIDTAEDGEESSVIDIDE